jgi:phenylalanine-4-hydroxylase
MTATPPYETNTLIDQLPKHLRQFIKPQSYDDYTPINQAVWRYVMRKNVDFLARVAHDSYLAGLAQTGIEIDEIPSMYGMNRILKEIGWAAVAVDGFIPPNAFMEFQAYKVLVIASDIRQLENIAYTPAPDIIHEAAGHAPIIANPDYAEYLRRLGAIGAKAILSSYDMDLYEAVRKLSILKEAEQASPEEIAAAENEVNRLQMMEVEDSEMSMIRNLQWWSVEYGLVGKLDDPKIYGAGLLSSIGESKSCLKEDVAKIPYSIAAAKQVFDITRPQPQLFVTPDFSYLMEVLEEFANTLSLRRGGRRGLQKLIESQLVGTIELNTGLQVSGKFTRMITNDDLEVLFFQTEGPTALSYREKELIGHGIHNHPNGFSSPLGKLKNINLAIEDMGPTDLKAYHFYDGKWLSFEFASGIKVEGMNVTGIRSVQGKLLMIQLKDCTITYQEKVLYRPEQGVYNMVIGTAILSAYAGAADHDSFPNLYAASASGTIKSVKSAAISALEQKYAQVRQLRSQGIPADVPLRQLFDTLATDHPNDWLLTLEMYEIAQADDLRKEMRKYLEALQERLPRAATLIEEGMELLE